MKVYCTNCGHEASVPESAENQTVRCETCGADFTVMPSSRKHYDMPEGANLTTMRGTGMRPSPVQQPEEHRSGVMRGATDVTMEVSRPEDSPKDKMFRKGDIIMGRYEILDELGRGGMGVVYKCFDRTGGVVMALKSLPPELSHSQMEMEEVRDNFALVNQLAHPNIAVTKTIECDEATGDYYLIMECVEGEDLRRWIKNHRGTDKRLTVGQILPVIRQIADALDYAHKRMIIHRDIKPENIMIDKSGDVKILDFGLAAQIHTSLSRVSMQYNNVSGAGRYMAPEQWGGRSQSAATDQYALAVMVYEMLSGNLPFVGMDIFVLIQKKEAEPIPDVPDFVQSAVRRAMKKNPQQRFASCTEFVKALEGEKKKHYIWILMLFVLLFAGMARIVGYNNNQEKQSNSGITNTESNRTFTIGNGVALDMVYVSAGSFTMGSIDIYASKDETPHTVTLTKDYWIGKYEVTQEQYEAVMGTNPPHFKNGAKYPVEEVSWNDAQDFCKKLNSRLSSQLPNGYEFRLPTEAEWEYAARGGKKSKGYKYSGSNDIGSVAWYKDNSGDTTHPVGGKSPNELGIYDMSGNVWEWCLDYCNYNSTSNTVETDTYRNNMQDPLCTTGSSRVLRGGSWDSFAWLCRVSFRNFIDPSYGDYYLGFRLALAPCSLIGLKLINPDAFTILRI